MRTRTIPANGVTVGDRLVIFGDSAIVVATRATSWPVSILLTVQHNDSSASATVTRRADEDVELIDVEADGRTLDAIAEVLDGVEWSADTLDTVAALVRDAGRTVGDLS